jgi:hypothetical protein
MNTLYLGAFGKIFFYAICIPKAILLDIFVFAYGK